MPRTQDADHIRRGMLAYIREYEWEHGVPPSVREIAASVRRAPSTVVHHLKRMHAAGDLVHTGLPQRAYRVAG